MSVTNADQSEQTAQHDHNTKQGITFIWALLLSGMIPIVAVIGGSEVLGDPLVSEVDALAAGSVNAIGLIAVGGINAIGIISLGLVNSIGVVSIGGVNSVGVISIGGFQSVGIIRIGGVNQMPFPINLWGATIFTWDPRIASGMFSQR